jgi:hypothetical protein
LPCVDLGGGIGSGRGFEIAERPARGVGFEDRGWVGLRSQLTKQIVSPSPEIEGGKAVAALGVKTTCFVFELKMRVAFFLGWTTPGVHRGYKGTTPTQQVGNRRTDRRLRCVRGGAKSADYLAQLPGNRQRTDLILQTSEVVHEQLYRSCFRPKQNMLSTKRASN